MDNQPNNNPPNQAPNQTFSPQQTPPTDSNTPPTTPGTQPAQPPAQPIAVGAEKSHKSKVWLLILLVLIMAGIGGYLLYSHRSKPAPVVTKTAVKRDVPLIRLATANGPVNVFYPSKDIIADKGMQSLNNQIFEGLVGWQGGTKLVPLLSVSWTNPNDSTWVFTIRKNVKFHTGNILSATDVKYSLDKFKDVTYDGNFGTTIKSVEVVSPTQVKITTDGPDPLLLNRLANLYIVDSKGTKPNDPINGTGPYILKTGTDPVKDQFTDLVPFADYWGGHVYTRELQYSQIIKEADLVAAAKNKKIDIIDTLIDQTSVTDLKAANITVTPQPSLATAQIFYNTLKTGSPLGNLKFRQALSIGIDRNAIIKAAGVEGTPIGQYMVSVVPGYVPKLAAPTQDVTKAKDLITQSGVKSASLTLSYGTSSSNLALLTEFQKEAAVLGVTVKLDPIEDINVLVKKFQDGKTDMMFVSNATVLFDGSDVLVAFQNPGVYDNAAVDKLLTEANQTLDGAKHLSLLQQAAEALDSDAAGIPLYTRTEYYAQANHAYNLTIDVPGLDASGVYFWKVYQ